MRWPGLIIAVTGVVFAIVLGSGASSFVDLPSILFVLLVGGGILAAAHGFHAIADVSKALFGYVEHGNSVAVKRAAETGRHSFVAAGWVGVLIGVVQMLSELEDPSQLGRGMAVSLLTAFYGYLLAYLICLPVERATSEP
jgi:flagellar motor component MotA